MRAGCVSNLHIWPNAPLLTWPGDDLKLQNNSWTSTFQIRALSKCLVRQCTLLGQLIKTDTLNTPRALHTIQSHWRKCLGLSIGRIFPVLETLNTACISLSREEAASQTRIGCLLTCVYTWDGEAFSADLLRALNVSMFRPSMSWYF